MFSVPGTGTQQLEPGKNATPFTPKLIMKFSWWAFGDRYCIKIF